MKDEPDPFPEFVVGCVALYLATYFIWWKLRPKLTFDYYHCICVVTMMGVETYLFVLHNLRWEYSIWAVGYWYLKKVLLLGVVANVAVTFSGSCCTSMSAACKGKGCSCMCGIPQILSFPAVWLCRFMMIFFTVFFFAPGMCNLYVNKDFEDPLHLVKLEDMPDEAIV